MNNNKKPSRKRDWTPRTTTKILIATICMQLVTLVALIIRIFSPPFCLSILPQKGATHKEVHLHHERLDHIH